LNPTEYRLNARIRNKIKPLSGVENIERLHCKIINFCERHENRDGRGTRQQVISTICTLIRQLKMAQRWSASHPDPAIQTLARKLMRAICNEPIEALMSRASKFEGELKKAGRRANLSKKKGAARGFELRNGFCLRELTTTDCLLSIGKQLQLCVGDPKGLGEDYHDALRDGSSDFWALESGGQPVGLLEVDIETQTVTDLQGKSNRLPKGWKFSIAQDIMQTLDVSGNDCEAFQRVGAFDRFRKCRPQRRFLPTCLGELQLWAFEKELIISRRTGAGKRRYWSRFKAETQFRLSSPNWISHGVDEDQLAFLAATNKAVSDAIELVFQNVSQLRQS
jgi:hypothetical protein